MSSPLNRGAAEPALPHVAGTAMALVMPPGVCDRQRLEDTADRLPGIGAEQQVEVVVHEAVTEQPEWVCPSGLLDRLKEGSMVVASGEHVGAVVPTVDCVVNQFITDQSRISRGCLAMSGH